MPGHPEILYVSNIQENGKDIGHADAVVIWHSDMSFEKIRHGAVLHAKEVPVMEDGTVLGDTLFASVKAYESLNDEIKEKLKGKQVVHDVLGRRRQTGAVARIMTNARQCH